MHPTLFSLAVHRGILVFNMRSSVSMLTAILVLSVAGWAAFYMASQPLSAADTAVLVGASALVVVAARFLWSRRRSRTASGAPRVP